MISDDLTRIMIFRRNLIRVSVTFVVTFAFVWKGNADTTKPNGNEPAKPTKSAANDKPTLSSEGNESSDKSATTSTRRDPFLVPAKLIRTPKIPKPIPPPKPEPKPLPAPSIENRINDHKKLVREYYEGRISEPSKLAPYLIDELAVTGVFRNDEGYGAFVVEGITQKQQTFFARAGWKTYDGYIKEILPTGVKFIKIVRLDNGTVRQTEEFRALPAANAK
jgi:hypothetical protein